MGHLTMEGIHESPKLEKGCGCSGWILRGMDHLADEDALAKYKKRENVRRGMTHLAVEDALRKLSVGEKGSARNGSSRCWGRAAEVEW